MTEGHFLGGSLRTTTPDRVSRAELQLLAGRHDRAMSTAMEEGGTELEAEAEVEGPVLSWQKWSYPKIVLGTKSGSCIWSYM